MHACDVEAVMLHNERKAFEKRLGPMQRSGTGAEIGINGQRSVVVTLTSKSEGPFCPCDTLQWSYLRADVSKCDALKRFLVF